jgi:kynureninase
MPVRGFEPGADGARSLDAADELAAFRRRFELPRDAAGSRRSRGRTLIYLCGHSLGLMPRAARRDVVAELDRWAEHGVDGHLPDPKPRRGRARPERRHDGWLGYHERFAAPLAALAGAERGEIVAMNTLTVNLHLMLVTFFRPTPRRYKILIERDAFPSDRYAVVSQLKWHGLDPAEALLELPSRSADGAWRLDRERFDTLLAAEGDRIALILLPGVQYLSGERIDIAALTAEAHRYGCKIGFDLAHAIGNVPLALHRDGPDFAVWCSYKYLNAGPGAVGGCFVHDRWAATEDLPRFAGWWGHDPKRRFLMQPEFTPIRGAQGWQLSNPPILSLAPLAASLDLFKEAGFARLSRKSIALTSYLDYLLRAELGGRARILTPAAPDRRGAQLAVQFDPAPRHPQAFATRLRAAGVVADWRPPHVLRLAPVPLYNRFRDVYAAVRALLGALDA